MDTSYFQALTLSRLEQLMQYLLPQTLHSQMKSAYIFPVQSHLLAVFLSVLVQAIDSGLEALSTLKQRLGSAEALLTLVDIATYEYQSYGTVQTGLTQGMYYPEQLIAELQNLVYAALSMNEKVTKILLPNNGYEELFYSSRRVDIEISALASVFQVTVMRLVDDCKSLYSLPIFSAETGDFPMVSIQLGNYSVCYQSKMYETPLCAMLYLRLWRKYLLLESLIALPELQVEDYQRIYDLANQGAGDAKAVQDAVELLDGAARPVVMNIQFNKVRCRHSECSKRLLCTHWVCSQCVFGTPPTYTFSPGYCPYCSYSLSLKEIELVLSVDALQTQLTYAESQGMSFCFVCQMPMTSAYIRKLPCQHRVCIPCALFAINSAGLVCPICERGWDAEISDALLQIGCWKCRQTKPAVDFPGFHCNGQFVCFNCFTTSTTCPLDSHPLTYQEMEQVSKAFFKCEGCGEVLNTRQKCNFCPCLCRLCLCCTLDAMRKKRDTSCCPRCGELVLEEVAEGLKFQLPDGFTEPYAQVSDVENDATLPCAVCREYDESMETLIHCTHIKHISCLCQFLVTQFVTGGTYDCPICASPIMIPELPEVLGPIKKLCAKETDSDLKCPKCAGLPTIEDAVTTKCTSCNKQYCRKCHKELSQSHTQTSCTDTRIKLAIAHLEQVHIANFNCPDCTEAGNCGNCEHVAQCPKCKIPCYYPGKKEWVCLSPACETAFCMGCSSALEPIKAHGFLWHRPQCPFSRREKTENAQESIDIEEMKTDCPACQTSHRRCSPPADLPTRGRFAP